LEFDKRGQQFIRSHNETLSVVAMGVRNPDRLSVVHSGSRHRLAGRRQSAKSATGVIRRFFSALSLGVIARAAIFCAVESSSE
jgi:hypothetical protein